MANPTLRHPLRAGPGVVMGLRRASRWVAAAAVVGLVAAIAPMSSADTLAADGDTVTVGDQTTIELGTVAPGAVITRAVALKLVCAGKNHVDDGQTVTLAFSAASVAAGGSLTGTSPTVTIPTSWPDDTTGGGNTNCPTPAPAPLSTSGSVTITAPTSVGAHSFTAKWSDSMSPSGGDDSSEITSNDPSVVFNLTVAAPAPVANAGADQTANEGALVTLDGSATTGATSYSWTQLTGPVVTLTGATTTSPSFTAPDGPTSLSFRLSATGAGGTRTDTVAVSVSNVAPVVSLSGDAAATEGSTKTYTFTATDVPGDALTFVAGSPSCGAQGVLVGSPTVAGGAFQCRFPDGPATSTVSVRVQDDEGAPSNQASTSVTIANAAPTVGLTGTSSVAEGSAASYAFTVTDPGVDTFSLATGHPDCGAAGALVAGSLSTTAAGGSFACHFADGPASSTVSIQVADSDGAASNTASVGTGATNVAPVVTLSGSATANEGDTLPYTYGISDPGVLDTFTIVAGCGGGGILSNLVENGSTGSFDCTFPDGPATSTVSVSATDDADTGTSSQGVMVANVAPTVTVTGPATVDEGSSAQFDFVVADPGADDHTVSSRDCGTAGSRADVDADTFTCTYPDGPAYPTVTVTVNDGDADGIGTADVTVDNVAPTVALTGASTAQEGSTTGYTYTVDDPGEDDFTAVPSCGDHGDLSNGSTHASGGSFDCTFPDGPATSTVSVDVTDSDGAAGSDSASVEVSNVAPSITALTGASAADEGETKTYGYAVFDPGADTFTASASCGDHGTISDETQAALGGSFDCTFTEGPNTSLVALTVTDDDGAADGESTSVTIANVAPSVTLTLTQTSACGVSVSATFTDPGTADSHIGSIDWGDATSSAATVSGSGGSGTATGSHSYVGPGTMTILVTVTDDDTGAGSDSESFVPDNSASAFMAPINTGSGPRSVFKLGSSIPAKILIRDCAGALVTNLVPQVQLQKVDSTPDFSVNEAQITEVPTNGKAMAWNGEHYHYVLSTKRSQFTGGALQQGTYKLYVTDPSLYVSPVAYFDLR